MPAFPSMRSMVMHFFGTMSPFLSKWNVPMIPFLTFVLKSDFVTDNSGAVRLGDRVEQNLCRLTLVDRVRRHLALHLRVRAEAGDELLAGGTERTSG